LNGILLFLARVLQLLAVGIDRGVASGCRLGVRRVFVSRALIFFSRLAEILVLEEKVREAVVDRWRLAIRPKRLEAVAVPSESLVTIREFLVRILRVLILRVVMISEVLQVCLQVGDSLLRVFWLVVSPVFGLQSVLRRELPLRLQHQLGESALRESF